MNPPLITPSSRWLLRLVSALSLLLAWASLKAQEADFQAGFAIADITPPAGWRRAGSYTELISTAGGDPLLAKAIVLSQGATAIAFVGNDLCSVPRELTDRARRQASQKTGIPFDHIVITATHTHGGPEYYGPLRDFLHARAMKENGGKDPRELIDYQQWLAERWAEVIVQAHAARRPATLSALPFWSDQEKGLPGNEFHGLAWAKSGAWLAVGAPFLASNCWRVGFSVDSWQGSTALFCQNAFSAEHGELWGGYVEANEQQM